MKFCPHCGNDISAHLAASTGAPVRPLPSGGKLQSQPAARGYDQTKIWKEMVAIAQERIGKSAIPEVAALVDPAVESLLEGADPTANVDGLSTVVHLMFDRTITPRGGILTAAVTNQGEGAPSLEQFQLHGYLVVNGKVVQVDGVPVGRAYGVVDYWGGQKQFKRWHLARPVEINPSRNGDPFFMDDAMFAFGAVWRDMAKIRDAMMTLLSTFVIGMMEGDQIAIPVALKITQHL